MRYDLGQLVKQPVVLPVGQSESYEAKREPSALGRGLSFWAPAERGSEGLCRPQLGRGKCWIR
jgi:hypothetical protein